MGIRKRPAIVLKVMSGDAVDLGVRYLYHNKTGSFVTGRVEGEKTPTKISDTIIDQTNALKKKK